MRKIEKDEGIEREVGLWSTQKASPKTPSMLGTHKNREGLAQLFVGGSGVFAHHKASFESCGVVYRSYHAFLERDDIEAGRTCPRAKAGPVKALEPAIPATRATPVNTHGFTIVTYRDGCVVNGACVYVR